MISASISLSACTATGNLPLAPADPVPADAHMTKLAPYRIEIGDILDVRLLLSPELDEEVTVRPDGHISTTVVPDELAHGRTVTDLGRVDGFNQHHRARKADEG